MRWNTLVVTKTFDFPHGVLGITSISSPSKCAVWNLSISDNTISFNIAFYDSGNSNLTINVVGY